VVKQANGTFFTPHPPVRDASLTVGCKKFKAIYKKTTFRFGCACPILSTLAKEKKLIRMKRGAYHKPKSSSLCLGYLPVYEEEKMVSLSKNYPPRVRKILKNTLTLQKR